MEIGISSSCLYPMQTELSLRTLGEIGVKNAEIFFNSPSELKGELLKEIVAICNYYDINVRSIHPFTSAYESILFFSDYSRRTYDGLKFYKDYFRAGEVLRAETLALHGCWSAFNIEPEVYAERLSMLNSASKEYGMSVSQENVNKTACADPKYMKKVADLVGEDFRMILDIKQCRRAGFSEFEFIRLLGGRISQVHISDYDDLHDCLAPGKGKYDFARLFKELKNSFYDKSAIIELYRNNFENEADLKDSLYYLEEIKAI